MLLEIAKQYKDNIKLFRPYAPASERKVWESLPPKLQEDLIKAGEDFLDYPYPLIPATKYLEYTRIGNRFMFESLYFTRRRVLNTLVLAECVEHKGRFIDDIVNGVVAICEESGWQLPSHNYQLNTETFCLPDSANPIVDLFSCETGAQLAMVFYLLKEELDEVSRFINQRIQREISQRILTPYLTNHFSWMGEYGQKVNNWTAWCTQNTLIAALSIETVDQETKKRILDQAAKSLDIFLDVYGEDGCCNEGAGYYHAAGLCLFNALEVINATTEDAFSTLYQNTKIKNIAPYIMNVHIEDKYYANFADCSCRAERAGVREFLFGKRTGNDNLMQFAAKDHAKDENYILSHSENLFYRLQAAFTEKEISAYDYSAPIIKEDIYYNSVGLMIARDSRFFLAVKAGGNNDSHNHNDTGSIIIYKDSKPLLVDVGVETYSRKTFSKERYEIWTMQSCYHNVLTFGERMQLAGNAFASKNVEVSMTETSARISMELSDCYPKGTIDSYTREVIFEKEMEIRITDSFSPFWENTYLSLMSLEKPNYDKGVLKLGDLDSILLKGDYSVEIETIAVTDPRLQVEWGNTLYRILVHLNKPQLTFIIKT